MDQNIIPFGIILYVCRGASQFLICFHFIVSPSPCPMSYVCQLAITEHSSIPFTTLLSLSSLLLSTPQCTFPFLAIGRQLLRSTVSSVCHVCLLVSSVSYACHICIYTYIWSIYIYWQHLLQLKCHPQSALDTAASSSSSSSSSNPDKLSICS